MKISAKSLGGRTLALALGVLTVAPLSLSTSVEAAPVFRPMERRYERRNNRVNRISFVARVTKVKSGNQVQVSYNGNNYDVYTRNRLPLRLDKGDTVRVTGVRYGDNDVRRANVTLLRNR